MGEQSWESSLGRGDDGEGFWLKEITKHASLVRNVLTLQVTADKTFDINAIEIRFRDSTMCILIGAKQIKKANKYSFTMGKSCVKMLVENDLLRWQEKSVRNCHPTDPRTGYYDRDQMFYAIKVRNYARRFEDIVGIDTCGLYESKIQPRKIHAEVFDDNNNYEDNYD